MKYFLDVNALVALGFLQHEFHKRVAQWVRALASKGVPELLTCSITEFGFVRVLAQAPLYGFTVSQASSLLLRLKAENISSNFRPICKPVFWIIRDLISRGRPCRPTKATTRI